MPQTFARLLTHALRNSCNDVMSTVDAAKKATRVERH